MDLETPPRSSAAATMESIDQEDEPLALSEVVEAVDDPLEVEGGGEDPTGAEADDDDDDASAPPPSPSPPPPSAAAATGVEEQEEEEEEEEPLSAREVVEAADDPLSAAAPPVLPAHTVTLSEDSAEAAATSTTSPGASPSPSPSSAAAAASAEDDVIYVTFGAGSLGLSLDKRSDAGVVLNRFTSKDGQAKSSGLLELGDIVVEIAGENVVGRDTAYVVAIVRSAPRPLVIGFTRPDPADVAAPPLPERRASSPEPLATHDPVRELDFLDGESKFAGPVDAVAYVFSGPRTFEKVNGTGEFYLFIFIVAYD